MKARLKVFTKMWIKRPTNWPKGRGFTSLGLFVFCGLVCFALGCGVRGDPAAPLTPAEIGRGHPSYRGYSEDYTPAAKVTGDRKELEDDEEEE